MKTTIITLAATAAAVGLAAAPAAAAEPANMQDREAVAEVPGLGIDYDLSAGVDNAKVTVVDHATGETIADVSEYADRADVTVDEDGTVSVD